MQTIQITHKSESSLYPRGLSPQPRDSVSVKTEGVLHILSLSLGSQAFTPCQRVKSLTGVKVGVGIRPGWEPWIEMLSDASQLKSSVSGCFPLQPIKS